MRLLTGAAAVCGGLRDGPAQGAAARLGGEPAELLLLLNKLDSQQQTKTQQIKYFLAIYPGGAGSAPLSAIQFVLYKDITGTDLVCYA